MFLRFYISRHIFRDFSMVIIFLILIILSIAAHSLSDAVRQEEGKLSDHEINFPIWLEASDIKGLSSDNLYFTNSYVWLFTIDGNGYNAAPYLTDICFKRTEKVTIDGGRMNLCGITRREADSRLAPEYGAGVQFFEGFSWDDFLTDNAVCLVGGNLSEADSIFATLDRKESTEINLTVIGTISSGPKDVVYVPWEYINNLCKAFFDEDVYSEVLRARVKDNTKLDELKETMKRYFTNADPLHTSTEYRFALTIFDSLYVQSHRSIINHLSVLRASRGLCTVLVVLIGLSSGFLILRGRQREYRLINAMGLSPVTITVLFLLEYGLICLFALGIFLIGSVFFPSLCADFAYVSLIVSCFLAGIFISILHLSHSAKYAKGE